MNKENLASIKIILARIAECADCIQHFSDEAIKCEIANENGQAQVFWKYVQDCRKNYVEACAMLAGKEY